MTGQEFSRVSEYTDEMNPVSDFTKTENVRGNMQNGHIFNSWLLVCVGLPWQHISKGSAWNAGDTGWSLDLGDSLEKEMATHASTLAWKVPWMEEPGRLQSMGLQRVGHDWLHFHFFTQRQYGVWFSPLILKEGFFFFLFFFFNDISSYLLISAWNWRKCFGLELQD